MKDKPWERKSAILIVVTLSASIIVKWAVKPVSHKIDIPLGGLGGDFKPEG